jgi:hypothetical protein
VGTRDRRCATDAQPALDVAATTDGIARWQDRGLGDSTVARAGFHSSHQSSIYHAPAGRLVLTGSAGPEGPGRGDLLRFNALLSILSLNWVSY